MVALSYPRTISATASNLHDRLEDQLTGDFFGAMRYLPFEAGLLYVLKSIQPVAGPTHDKFRDCLEQVRGYQYTIQFWPKYQGYGVIDALLIPESKDFVCGIEVKLHSGLSSEDPEIESDIETLEKDIENSHDQLIRYGRLLKENFQADCLKHLILVAPMDMGIPIAGKMKNGPFPVNVGLSLLTWQDALEGVKNALKVCLEEGQRLILGDLRRLLEQKGFEHFRNFLSASEPPQSMVEASTTAVS